MLLSDVDFRDIQGLLRFGHGHLSEARFYLIKIKDSGAAKSWLAAVSVTNAVKVGPPDEAVQVAFTYDGLRVLGLADDILDQFSHEFRTGMYEPNRSRRLGDVGASDPDNWYWGKNDDVPHMLVMIFAKTNGMAALEKEVKKGAWSSAFETHVKPLETHQRRDTEHFGFVDGTSQPKVDWERQKNLRRANTAGYSNVSALGEFVLGYPNEYGNYTRRPLIDVKQFAPGVLPLAEDEPGKLDFGRNGTYLVFRDLEQDVPAFREFVAANAGDSDVQNRKLRTAMVGRQPDGIPIEPDGYEIVQDDDAGRTIPEGAPVARLENLPVEGVGPKSTDIWLNQFTYGNDLAGTACPHGAHARRANPRTGDLPYGARNFVTRVLRMIGFDSHDPHQDLVSSTRFHRILRRGWAYGPDFSKNAASKRRKKSDERGLRFICLNANISRQFEFIQSSWLENPKFEGLENGDPLVGSRTKLFTGAATDGYCIPQDSGAARRLDGLQQFVTVKGGAYFFMPGLRAIRFIAGQ